MVQTDSTTQPSQPSAPACPVCRADRVRFFQHIGEQWYWRCERCQATLLEPGQRLNKAAEKAHYDYHQNAVDDDGYRQFLNRLAEPLLARVAQNARSGQHGLDYGCGPGPALAAMLQEAGHSMSLWDPIYAPDRQVLHSSYDFITCTEVLEHCYDPACAFAQMIDLLKPGGWLGLMTTFQTDDARFAQWHYRRDPTHVVFYRSFTLRYLAEQHGCNIEFPAANVALLQLRPAT